MGPNPKTGKTESTAYCRVGRNQRHLPLTAFTAGIVPGVRAMNVGVCRINLRLPENESLKGKRRILKSIISRVGNKFNVAIAEVDNGDMWQLATIGICCVSNDRRPANEVMSRVVDFIINSRPDAEILDYKIEIIPVS